jgi:hypothetical protein
MQLAKLGYGRVDEVSYWVDISLGQRMFPRDPSLIHLKWMNWSSIKTQWAWGSWHTRGCSVSFMGSFVEGVWHLRLQCNFPKPIVFPFFIYFMF